MFFINFSGEGGTFGPLSKDVLTTVPPSPLFQSYLLVIPNAVRDPKLILKRGVLVGVARRSGGCPSTFWLLDVMASVKNDVACNVQEPIHLFFVNSLGEGGTCPDLSKDVQVPVPSSPPFQSHLFVIPIADPATGDHREGSQVNSKEGRVSLCRKT